MSLQQVCPIISPSNPFNYFRLYLDASAQGTVCWLTDLRIGASYFAMTSNTTPSPFVASNSNASSSAWKHFDGVTGGAVPVLTNVGNWIQIKTPSTWAYPSFSIAVGSGTNVNNYPSAARLFLSTTGDYAGEQVLLRGFTGKTWAVNEEATWSIP